MKRCPTCNKTYSDDSMSFCLEDGAPLLTVGGGGADAPAAGFDPNLTIPFTPPRDTSEPRVDPYRTPSDQWSGQAGGPQSGQYPQSGGSSQPGSSGSGYGQPQSGQYGQSSGQYGQQSGQFGGTPSGQFPPPPQSNQYQPTPSWSPQPPPSYATAPRKSSALPWVLGGIGLLVVLGVVAAVVVGVLASMGSNTNKNNANNSNALANKSNRNANSNSNSNSNSNANNSNSNANSGSKPFASDDFSTESWWTGTVNIGSAWYQSGEYHVRSTATSYMVIYSPSSFRTENATTRITARSVSGSSPFNGYGLAIFGEMSKKNELEDYCFLIRTSGTPAYRIVMHRGGTETIVADWTDASQLRTGTSPNQLEVRASGTQAAFYINGQYIRTIEATSGYAVGVAGVYTSGTEEVAFDDLQISK